MFHKVKNVKISKDRETVGDNIEMFYEAQKHVINLFKVYTKIISIKSSYIS